MFIEQALTLATLAAGSASAILAVALWYLSTVPGSPAVTRWWAAGLLVNTVEDGVRLFGTPTPQAVAELLSQSAEATASLLLFAGTMCYVGLARQQRWVYIGLPLLLAWTGAFLWLDRVLFLAAIPLYALIGITNMSSGLAFWSRRTQFPSTDHIVVGVAFMVWGLHKMDDVVIHRYVHLALFDAVLSETLSMVLAVGLIILAQRRQSAIAEQATRRAQVSEANLQATEARFRDLIDNSVLGVIIHRDNSIVYANPAAARLFGYSTTMELASQAGLAALAAPEEMPRLRGYVRAQRKGQVAPEHYEFRGRTLQGTTLWLENTVRQIVWEGEAAEQATLYDITEKKRWEDELRAQERLLQTVIDAIPHIVIVRDRDARLLTANTAWYKSFGITPDDVRGHTSVELRIHPPEEAKTVHYYSQLVLESERPASHEHEMTVGDVRRRFQTIRTPLRNPQGNTVGVVSISVDITDQRAMEEQLRQAQKMEAVGQLTGGVAHDFNNLLSIVIGNLELLEKRQPLDTQGSAYVQRAMKAAERGAALTQRLLAFSRRQTLQPQPVEMHAQVMSMLDLLRSSLGEAIRIETRCTGGPCFVQVDPNQLENALLNLALNARDAMPDGGVLTIELECLDDGSSGTAGASMVGLEGPWVMLAVRDSGAGMSEHVLARAVEPFFTTKEPGSGSGLGLSMIYGFMEQSGGHMHLQSTVGQGTVVRLYFRRIQPPPPDAIQETVETARQGTGQTVLVVEDDPAVAQLASEMLAELQCTPIRALDGQEALKALHDNPEIVLLFTDVVLPNGMDGVLLAEQARQLRPGIKVLFTSGYADSVFKRHGRGFDGAELLHKPYRLVDLADKIHTVLDRRVTLY